jgi:hypothetical protein
MRHIPSHAQVEALREAAITARLTALGTQLQHAAYPESSKSAQRTPVNHWYALCALTGGNTLDTSEDNMILFVAYLVDKKTTKYNSITKYISNFAHFCAANNMPHPRNGRYRLNLTLRGAKRTLGAAIQQGRPVELEFIVSCVDQLNPSSCADSSTWGAMIAAFYAMLRKSETTLADRDTFNPIKHLTRASVEIIPRADTPNQVYLRLRLRHSKTLPDQGHVDIYLAAHQGISCPVRAISHLLEVHTNKDPDAPLFQNEDGSPMRHSTFLNRTRHLLQNSAAARHIDPKEWLGTSFRAGGCSAAFAAGISPALIKLHGRWLSDAVFHYAHLDLGTRLSMSGHLMLFEKKSSDSRSPIFDSFYLNMKCKT